MYIFPLGSTKVTVVIDGYTVDSTQSSPASLPLGTALVDKLFHWNYAEPADNRPKSLSAGRPKSDFDGNQ